LHYYIQKNFDAKRLDAFTKYTNEAKAAAASGSGSGSFGGAKVGSSASGSSSYSESETTSSLNEARSTEVTIGGIGGDPIILGGMINDGDIAIYQQWYPTINKFPFRFCDFVPGTIVPIYELIPAGHRLTAAMVKQASENYQIEEARKKGVIVRVEVARGISKAVNFNTKGSATCLNGDKEICSSSGKTTHWKVRATLLNLEDGTAACAIALTVYEGGEHANKSILQNRTVHRIPNQGYQAMAINTDWFQQIGNNSNKYGDVWECCGNIVGKNHDWNDVTEKFAACPFFETDSHRVYVRIDGSGDDHDSIGLDGWLNVPYIAYRS